ncbi:MAG TPA: DEAD/DEAH box helicase, partial [Nannocystaceae bacterium]|nr:DEAD/DEAH box helicase [Nannocystaceae bacterium]
MSAPAEPTAPPAPPAPPAPREPDSDDPLDAALHRLGYTAFRSGQREAITTLLERGRLLLVAPTGGGKSLTFQLPAALLEGTTVVVSPLIALMHDQVEALTARGIPATYLASTLPGPEVTARMSALARGAYKLIYVAPERLAAPGFRDLVRRIPVPLLAIDEAHCIAEWGHDFRPEYLQLGDLVAELPRARVLACTATATPVVRDEILGRLGLPASTPQIINGFARPNLALRVREVQDVKERQRAVDAQLAEALGGPPRRGAPAG